MLSGKPTGFSRGRETANRGFNRIQYFETIIALGLFD
jgi:hypothetical protein